MAARHQKSEIHVRREALCLTLAQLAKKAGCSVATACRVESGAYLNSPSAQRIYEALLDLEQDQGGAR